jgi:hypothetical protein
MSEHDSAKKSFLIHSVGIIEEEGNNKHNNHWSVLAYTAFKCNCSFSAFTFSSEIQSLK